MSEALLTVQQVATLLSIKPVTVYAAVTRERLPFVRLWKGQRRSVIRFRRSDIDAWINERTIRSSQW